MRRSRPEPSATHVLLTPGPCQTSESVRRAASVDLNHREPQYLQAVGAIRAALNELAPGYHPHLLGGSGTNAMEAMLTSCVLSGPILVLVDGYYSRRMAEIAAVHKIPCDVLAFGWMDGWNLDQIESQLKSKKYEAVVATHHETTVGRLNPLSDLARITASLNVKLHVDAVSSLGADPVPLEGVDSIVGTANKCLHGLPGLSFVLTKEPVKPISSGPRTFSLDLTRFAGDDPPQTPPVQAVLSFAQSLSEWSARGGRSGRYSEYLKKTIRLRLELSRLGLELPIPETQSSITLVMASVPSGWDADQWYDWNLKKGYVLYKTKSPLHDRYFQVSAMGETTVADIESWLNVIKGK